MDLGFYAVEATLLDQSFTMNLLVEVLGGGSRVETGIRTNKTHFLLKIEK